MNPKIVEKFFANQTTPGEARKVLEWFETPEGNHFLQERFAKDIHLLNRNDLQSMVPELDSDELFRSIEKKINKQGNIIFLKRTDRLGYLVKAAAAVLVILTASFFTVTHQQFLEDQIVDREPVIFQTEDEQQREITLGDGSVVRMNKNSEMIVSKDFMQGSREITLSGEAYFDVVHNPDLPFIIHANQSIVEVLGTSFNVRSVAGQENVQVAVVDGRVTFSNSTLTNSNDLSVTLSKGQFGYLDISQRTILVDDLAVDNYLSWKSGRFIFEGLTLQQVCTQLNRLYDMNCSFEDEEVKNLQLTANFSNESVDKTLSVISLSLNIEFVKNEYRVHWTRI